MDSYRMMIPAEICFSIFAESEEDTITKAKKFMDDNVWCDGFDVAIYDNDGKTAHETRVYPNVESADTQMEIHDVMPMPEREPHETL